MEVRLRRLGFGHVLGAADCPPLVLAADFGAGGYLLGGKTLKCPLVPLLGHHWGLDLQVSRRLASSKRRL